MPDFSNLSGISSAAYTDYAAKNQYSNDVQKVVSNAPKSETEKELMEACKQFEAECAEKDRCEQNQQQICRNASRGKLILPEKCQPASGKKCGRNHEPGGKQFRFDFEVRGIVKSQSIKAGKMVPVGTTIRVGLYGFDDHYNPFADMHECIIQNGKCIGNSYEE